MAHRIIIGLFWATASHVGWHTTGVSFEINRHIFLEHVSIVFLCQLSLLSTCLWMPEPPRLNLSLWTTASSLGAHFPLCLERGRNGTLFVPSKRHPSRVSDSSGLLPHFAFIDTLLHWVDSRSWRARHSPHKSLCPGKLEDFSFFWV